MTTNILFICSKNQWRSPTAEKVYANDPRLAVRSAGVSSKSRRKISEQDLKWADIILVMEQKHKERILQMFPSFRNQLKIEILEIPDEYQCMDPELIVLIREQVDPIVKNFYP